MNVEVKSKKESKHYGLFSSISFRASVDLFKQIQEKGVIVFGASGEMGSKLSSTFPKASVRVLMQDIDLNKLNEAKSNVLETFEKALNKRKLPKKQFEIIKEKNLIGEVIAFPENGKIPFLELDKGKDFVSSFLNKAIPDSKIRSNYTNVTMVLEAGPENLQFKQNVFQFFELALNSNDAILSTNTSSLKISDIAGKVNRKDRVVGFDYFLPAHINPLIEIIVSDETSPEIIHSMYNLAIAMGKKPVICFGDMPGAIANRILVGVLNEAARIYDEGLGNPELIDKIFLETFYSKQIKIQTNKAKRQFEAAPKLGFFKDEKHLYKQIAEEKILLKKKNLLEKAEGNLRQKVLYCQIVENHAPLGAFFTPSEVVVKIKAKAQEQIKTIRDYLNKCNENNNFLQNKFCIEPYNLPSPKNNFKSLHPSSLIISERLKAAYISIAQEIYKEGLGTIHDIELTCKEGFKWNIGPFELINTLSRDKVEYLTTMLNANIDQNKKTGISRPQEVLTFNPIELSGIQTYIQDNIGFITLGRLHIQNFQMMQNSISPLMLEAISLALKDFHKKKVKSIIFRSQGGGAFSSGADLNYIESINWDSDKVVEFINLGKKVMDEISCSKIPTVAVLDGPAVGGGLELALACDYRIMTDLSFVSMPEVGLGIIPDWGGTEKLPQIIGKELAKRMICNSTLQNLGLKLSAEDACTVGLTDVFVLQSELPIFLADLIENKNSKIDIFIKPTKKVNLDKSDYPEHIVKRFNLDKPFKHNFRFLTKEAALFAEDLINHSDDPAYSKKVNDDVASRKLFNAGKIVANLCIKPLLTIAQNKLLAPVFEKLGLL